MNRYDLVLLGFILEKDSSGYDIISKIKERGLERWAMISTSTVYNRLNYLESHNCIEGTIVQKSKYPPSKVYSITAKGRGALNREIIKHLTGFNDDPRTLGYAFLFGLEDKGNLVRLLEEHETKLRQEVAALEKMINEEPKPTLYPEGPFLNCMSRDHILVELKYLRAAIQILQNPQKSSMLDGFFYINFGNRDFQQKAAV
ncbi:MAG: PadR family transcriptional regulator [Fibromonadaceae bacterium]|jgi:DNA-binding PadR family transcriptional regulator|nr:PadR family transcriptional regulator [Fibromonadaceae bacterium]